MTNEFYACCRAGILARVKELCPSWEDDYRGGTVDNGLLLACDGGSVETVEFLLTKSELRSNALYRASVAGHLKVVQLIAHGLKIDDSFAAACGENHMDIVQYFFNIGIDMETLNWGLRNAAANGYVSLVVWLIEKGANDFDGALLWACQSGNYEPLICILIEKGGVLTRAHCMAAYHSYNWRAVSHLIRTYPILYNWDIARKYMISIMNTDLSRTHLNALKIIPRAHSTLFNRIELDRARQCNDLMRYFPKDLSDLILLYVEIDFRDYKKL